MVPPQMLIKLFTKGKAVYFFPWLWHKGICFIFGIKINKEGTVCEKRPALFVSNHISYLDIFVIGSYVKASFVAKKEVASWPLIGFLSKLQNTAFIDRRRSAAAREANTLAQVLNNKGALILFPEGTSHDGSESLPFRSNFFEIAAGRNGLPIQPISLQITKIDNRKVKTQNDRDKYAWYGDMELVPHLWPFAKSKGATIKMTFHEPVIVQEDYDRKKLAKLTEKPVFAAFK